MRKFLFVLLCFTALAACKRAELPEPNTGDDIVNVMASFDRSAIQSDVVSNNAAQNADVAQNAATRATSTTFEDGDQVGLYMVDFTGSTPTPLKTTGNQADNVRYTSDASGLLTTNPPLRFTKGHTGKTDIYAYYPYNSQLTQKDVNNYEFSVSESQVAGMSASDLCMASTIPTGIQPSASAVELVFEHKFAKIIVSLNMPRDYKDGLKIKGVSNFSFMGVAHTAKVNMGTQTVTTDLDKRYQALTPRVVQQGVVSDVDNTPHIVEMIAPAQEYPVGKLFLIAVLEFENGEHRSFSFPMAERIFGDNKTVAGMAHSLNFGVKPGTEMVFEGITVLPWNEGPGVSGELKDGISTEFSVGQQDFTSNFAMANRVKVTVEDSTVYDITDGITVAGGVCKFKFTPASGSPLNYGFRIVKLDFLNGGTSLYSCNMISDRVYNPTTMNLGLLPFSGAGTAASPYLIGNAVQLDLVRTLSGNASAGKYFRQTADIDIAPHLAIRYKAGSVPAGGDGSTLAFEPNDARALPHLGDDATGWLPLPDFSGSYDGNSYTISGVAINAAVNNTGLFGSLTYGGFVDGITLKNCYIVGNANVGGIAGYSDKGIVADCDNITGVVKGSENVSGVMGNLGVVVNCSNNATIYGVKNVGGVVGATSGYNSGLYNAGKVTSTTLNIGGVIGAAVDPKGQLYGGYNRGNVTGAAATTSGAVIGQTNTVNAILDRGYWLSTATYTNCGPNGYGTASVATNITNFEGLTAADMQNANAKDPTSLLYKLNQAGGKWVIAPAGHYNAGWPIPSTTGYIAGYYNGVAVPAAGAAIDVNIIAADGAAWTLTAADAAQATITTASGTGRGTASVAIKAHSGTARTVVLKATSNSITNYIYIKQAASGDVEIAGTKWTTRNLTGVTQGQTTGFTLADNPQDYGMFWKWGSLYMYNRVGVSTDHWGGITTMAATSPAASSTGDVGYDYGKSLGGGASPGDPCQALGVAYRTPTLKQWQDLDAMGSKWGTYNNIAGRFFGTDNALCTNTSIASGCIFLPAAGIRSYSDGSLVGQTTNGSYWSSSVHNVISGSNCYSYVGDVNLGRGSNRGEGNSVRCVQDGEAPPLPTPPVLIGSTRWTTGNLTGTAGTEGSAVSVSVSPYPQDYGMFWKWGSLYMYNRIDADLPVGHWGTSAEEATLQAATAPTAPSRGYDFGSPSLASSWGAPVGDPCKGLGASYKTPTQTQWAALVAEGYFGRTTYQGINGYFFGRNAASCDNTTIADGCIFLPSSGSRSGRNGSLGVVDNQGYYWSSSVNSATTGLSLYFDYHNVRPEYQDPRGKGISIRCIQE